MLRWSLIFLLAALAAALFGYTQIAVNVVAVSRVLFMIFIVLFIFSLIVPQVRKRRRAAASLKD